MAAPETHAPRRGAEAGPEQRRRRVSCPVSSLAERPSAGTASKESSPSPRDRWRLGQLVDFGFDSAIEVPAASDAHLAAGGESKDSCTQPGDSRAARRSQPASPSSTSRWPSTRSAISPWRSQNPPARLVGGRAKSEDSNRRVSRRGGLRVSTSWVHRDRLGVDARRLSRRREKRARVARQICPLAASSA